MNYIEFIERVQEDAQWDDPGKAERISRAVLGTLGELLIGTGRRHLAAQLPQQLQEYVYAWDDTREADRLIPGLRAEKIINLIQARAKLNHSETMKGIPAVLQTLRQAISASEFKGLEERITYFESLMERNE